MGGRELFSLAFLFALLFRLFRIDLVIPRESWSNEGSGSISTRTRRNYAISNDFQHQVHGFTSMQSDCQNLSLFSPSAAKAARSVMKL